MPNPGNHRLSYAINLTSEKVRTLGDIAVFKYGYPIAWVIQVFYTGFAVEFNNTNLVRTWFKGDGAVSAPQWFYTSFDYEFNEANFRDQAITPYTGGTYKVYGKTIQCYFELLSDDLGASFVVVAIPQVAEFQGANVEPSKISVRIQTASTYCIPQYSTDFCCIGSTQPTFAFSFMDKDHNVLVEFDDTIISVGEYIPIPHNAVYVSNDSGTDVYFSVKFYGAS